MVSEAQDSPIPREGEPDSSPVSPNQPHLELPDAGLPGIQSPSGLRFGATLPTRAEITRSLIVLACVTLIIYGMHLAALYLVVV